MTNIIQIQLGHRFDRRLPLRQCINMLQDAMQKGEDAGLKGTEGVEKEKDRTRRLSCADVHSGGRRFFTLLGAHPRSYWQI